MKYTLLFVGFLLSGCYALNNAEGARQPVKSIDIKQSLYKTTCSGLAESWPECLAKAKKTCVNGFETINREQTPVGAKRELTFQCKQ